MLCALAFFMDFSSLVSIQKSTMLRYFVQRDTLLHPTCTSGNFEEEFIQISRLFFIFVLTFGIDILQLKSVSTETVTWT